MANMDDLLKVGVIGAGWWGTSAHIPGIVQHEKAKLQAVQTRSIAKANKVARDFGAELAFDDYKALIRDGDVEAVVVSSTPNVHYEQARFALEHGKHVLMEKPMTFTAREAEALCGLAEKNGLHLAVSCPWHFTPHAEAARKVVQEGALGTVKMISILMTNPIDKLLKGIDTTPTHGLEAVYVEPGKGSYSDPSVAGGGQIYVQVSHVGAYLSFLLGAKAEEVFARFDCSGSQNDIYDTLNIKMTGGILVSLASTGATPLSKKNFEIRIYGTRAILLLELWEGEMAVYPFEGAHKIYPLLSAEEIYPERAPVFNFIDTCLGTAENRSPGYLGVDAMKIIEAAVLSNKNKHVIKVKDL